MISSIRKKTFSRMFELLVSIQHKGDGKQGLQSSKKGHKKVVKVVQTTQICIFKSLLTNIVFLRAVVAVHFY